jgi:hypothetical protein
MLAGDVTSTGIARLMQFVTPRTPSTGARLAEAGQMMSEKMILT